MERSAPFCIRRKSRIALSTESNKPGCVRRRRSTTADLRELPLNYDLIRRRASRCALPAGSPFSDLDSAINSRVSGRHHAHPANSGLDSESDIWFAAHSPSVRAPSKSARPIGISSVGLLESFLQHALPLHADAERIVDLNGSSTALSERSLHSWNRVVAIDPAKGQAG